LIDEKIRDWGLAREDAREGAETHHEADPEIVEE